MCVITGGHGFIGTNLCLSLSKVNREFRVIDINSARYPWSLDALYADITYPLPIIKGNILIHLAAETNIRCSIAHPRQTFTKNCLGLINCLDLLRSERFKHLIFTSSASSELSKSPYLASKLACEALCNAYREAYGLDIKVLKLSSVYGPYSIHKSSVIHAFIKNCINKEPMIIYGDGSQHRDFIYVADVVDAILRGKEGYIASGELTSIESLAEIISRMSESILNYKPTIIHGSAIDGEVKSAEAKTDIITSIDLEEGIYSTFQWYRKNYASQQLV